MTSSIFWEFWGPPSHLSPILPNRLIEQRHLFADLPLPKVGDVIYGRPYIRKEESDFLKMLQSSKNTGSTQIIVAIMLYGKLQHGM